MKNINIASLILAFAVLSLGIIIFILISLASIIYNKICFKTSFKQWASELKYFLLFYLCGFVILIVMIVMMFFRFWGIFSGILIFTALGGIIADTKNNTAFYIEEATDYKCACGNEIVGVYKIKTASERKLMYFICRKCCKKYNSKELEENDIKDAEK